MPGERSASLSVRAWSADTVGVSQTVIQRVISMRGVSRPALLPSTLQPLLAEVALTPSRHLFVSGAPGTQVLPIPLSRH